MHVGNSDTERRPTQAERRARSRGAILEAAARGLSRHGYGDLVLDEVAREAGYTRGALYHLFAGKEELALAVVQWVAATWEREVWQPAQRKGDPVEILVALARGHVVLCRRDVARVIMALRVEFGDRDHPVGRLVETITGANAERFAALIAEGRRAGSIPAGPPAITLALAGLAAVEGLAIQLAGVTRHDTAMAERVIRGTLGVAPRPPRGAR